MPGLRDQEERRASKERGGGTGSARVALRGRSLRKLVSINIQHSFLHFKFRGNTLSKARPSPGYASPVSPPLALYFVSPSRLHAINACALGPVGPNWPGTMLHIKIIMHLNLPSVAKDIAGGGRRSCLPLPGATTSSEGVEKERERYTKGEREERRTVSPVRQSSNHEICSLSSASHRSGDQVIS